MAFQNQKSLEEHLDGGFTLIIKMKIKSALVNIYGPLKVWIIQFLILYHRATKIMIG